MTLRKVILVLAGVVILLTLASVVGTWYVGFHDRGLNRNFDPHVIARAETRMWEAYYAGDKESVGLEIIVLLREQLGLSLRTSRDVGRDLAYAAHRFHQRGGYYEETVLPGLVTAYSLVRESVDGDWDPENVARAELEWWVKRRTPGQNNAESVGASVAHLYALLYGATNEDIEEAGLLRARAAILRDQGGPNADWSAVEDLLVRSYTALLRGIQE